MGYTPPQLEVRKITGGWSIYAPTGTSGDDVSIYPNTTNTYPYLKLDGNGDVAFYHVSKGFLKHIDNGTTAFYQYYDSANTEMVLESVISNKNLFLKTAGTGVLKFGSYTAGAATDSTGYITILDAAGNTRKLMVQA